MNESLQQELVKDLLVESYEGLDLFDRELLGIEQGEGGLARLNIVFRVIHTIKGTAGCIGLGRIEKLAHAGENLMSILREGKLAVSGEIVSALLSMSDALRGMLRVLESTGAESTEEHAPLLLLLAKLQIPPVAAAPAPVVAKANYGLFEEADEVPAVASAVPAAPEAPAASSPEAAGSAECAAEAAPETGEAASAPVVVPAAVAAAAAPMQARQPAPEAPAADNSGRGGVADSAIRVDINQLDKVMNLVGELVLARNQIVSNTTVFDQAALTTAAQRLNIITTELQESVMKTRMQPIGNVWAKFPRVVRDVAKDLGKKVRLVMQGQTTELDRTIIEAIKDPLTHIVRNSIDHGIEAPERRTACGKVDEGLLSLRAFHEGGQVIIEIMDDGHGIDLERVKTKAVSKSLISPEQAARMSDREAINLIFLPGLSTAEKISNVSGRGVGMDVVKTNIEKIGGSIDLQTQAGQGTTLRIKIPLTLAIIPALVVTSGGARYAIPQVSLLELVRLEGATARKGIEKLCGSPVYRLRGNLLPLAYINEQLGTAPGLGRSPGDDDVINIVVLQADGRPFGLVVDEINDTEEIVVKPLGKQLKGISCFAGATIMGDGRVALIIDVVGFAQHARVVGETRERAVDVVKTSYVADSDRPKSLLLFNVGGKRRMAIPLSLAARLEEFPITQIEHTGDSEVVQYRGQIMPLIRVCKYISGGVATEPDAEKLSVVVYSEKGRSVGFVVSSINDIVEEAFKVQSHASGRGLAGSAVVQGHVTDLLDVPGLIRNATPSFYDTIAA
ncbi:MAG: chemotaxis protein CheW [Opitutus sp.]|nr:chemotaxis protein CheW [Opitutus sp.]MCS6248029.1 chemotaxis protein CheW [Opitutus sp.]MCS6274005.1 chemotaxis protein CheW [Opitutus sp.]MCS6276794.1 chemotaxis protein CheW [Opitutus sp.]MCS6301557.1 chemotaxis protein CheW [Opitutus sp.]